MLNDAGRCWYDAGCLIVTGTHACSQPHTCIIYNTRVIPVILMAIRWRKDGTLVCAAMSEPQDGDTYIDDRLHYELSVESQVLLADPSHKENGLWHWNHGE